MEKKLICLQLNELNFDYIERYIKLGELPEFAKLFAKHGYRETHAEVKHELANPWIQWPTVHTGLDYTEHGVFRLGDIVKFNHELIYEVLERHGLTVAAICPFNASNNTRKAAFFIPDPWTLTNFSGPTSLRLIYHAARQVADDYANGRITLTSVVELTLGALSNFQWKNIPNYLQHLLAYVVKKKIW